MAYTKKQFGNELEQQVKSHYDIKKLSHWAYGIYLKYCNEFETGLYSIVMDIVTMAEGYEFQMSEDEILELVKKLETS